MRRKEFEQNLRKTGLELEIEDKMVSGVVHPCQNLGVLNIVFSCSAFDWLGFIFGSKTVAFFNTDIYHGVGRANDLPGK